jgi:hypothetical protein
MWTVKVPTSVPVSKNKRFSLNLNTYRNAHHHTLNKAKIEFDAIVAPLLGHIPRMDGVKLTFTLFTGTKQLADTSNICSIVEKFFCDTLVNAGRIEDDNYTVVLGSRNEYGGYTKGDSHVMVTLEPVGTVYSDPEKEEDMQITIPQREIEIAIKNYIMSQVSVNDDMDIDIQLRATRGEEGYQAIIDIKPKAAPTPTKPAKPASAATPKTPAAKAFAQSSGPAKTLDIGKKVEAAKVEPEVEQPAPEPSEEDLAPAGTVQAEPAEPANDESNVIPIAAEGEAAPAPKSIFANLAKPKNS